MIEKITKIVYRCTCDLPDCGKKNPAGIDEHGKPRSWDSKDDKIPDRCSWCKRRSWNGRDRRLKDPSQSPKYNWVRAKQCAACGGTEWKKDGKGNEVCAACGGKGLGASATKKARPTLNLPKPKKVRAIED